MKTTRKRYSADFKAKVALEAIRGDLTLAELGAKHGIHHTMIAAWMVGADERDAASSAIPAVRAAAVVIEIGRARVQIMADAPLALVSTALRLLAR